MSSTTPQHTIGVVSRMTGLTQHVIRVWEKRYEAVVPQRTDTNRRLYSEADVTRLRLLRDVTHSGHPISHVVALENNEIEELLKIAAEHGYAMPFDRARSTSTGREAGTAERYISECQVAAYDLDGARLESTLLRAHVSLSQRDFLEQLIAPLMVWVGEEWHAGNLRVAQEHLVSLVVRQFLMGIRSSYRPDPKAPTIVIATPPGQDHEIGALIIATVAAAEGWKELYIGTRLPAEEVVNVVEKTGACAVALSIVYGEEEPYVARELTTLHRYLGNAIPILVGGRGALSHAELLERMGAHILKDTQEFRESLRNIRGRAPEPIASPVN